MKTPPQKNPALRSAKKVNVAAFQKKNCQQYRTVLNLFVFEQWSHREIAKQLGIKENTSSSIFFRARKMLCRKIKDYLNNHLGLSVSYPLSQRLAVYTGVAYTILSTDFVKVMRQQQLQQQQTLHYVGIPLGIRVNLMTK